MADQRARVAVKLVDPTTSTQEAAVNASGNLTVKVNEALPAGTNNIGDVDVLTLPAGTVAGSASLPAGTNNIGDVDVLSVVPGTGATALGKAEDAAHSTGDTGVAVWGVRNDAAGTSFGADGDYTPLATDANGRVGITDLGGTISIDDGGGAITVDGTVAVSGTVTVDTELAAAGALADNTSNPTVTSVGAFPHWFDGSTWDRAPGTAADGLLVNLGGNNDVTVTGTVTVDSELPAAGALADATANPTVPAVGAFLMGWNGTTWDRVDTANTGRLQVDVVTGGGGDTPNDPKRTRSTSSSVAAGATADLDSTQISSGTTGKLERVICSASVPIKCDLKTVLNGSATTVATWFVPANDSFTFETRHRNYIQQAESATAGFDGFRVTVTNNDSSSAADVYAFFAYDES